MNILLVSITFPPEHCPAGYMIHELAAELFKKGHKVTIITGFPNHPTGKIFEGYRKRLWQIELLNGIRILRVWLFTSPNRGILSRILNFVSFTISSSLAILLSGHYEVMFSILHPLTNGLFYPFIKFIKKIKLIFSIQDLHPDSEIDTGHISNKFLIRLLRWIEKFSYYSADHLCVICNTFKDHIIRKGICKKKISVIPNWIDTDEITPLPHDNEFRRKCGLNENVFVILFAGTLGYASGALVLVEVAQLLKNKSEIKFLFIGEGPLLDKMLAVSRKENLKNILFMPFQPRELVPFIQATANVSLVTMAPKWAKKSAGFSSKILGYMAAARPIIGALDSDSEMASIIKQAKCGVVVAPNNALKIAAAIEKLIKSSTLRAYLGKNGRIYAEQHFSRTIVVASHISLINSVAKLNM